MPTAIVDRHRATWSRWTIPASRLLSRKARAFARLRRDGALGAPELAEAIAGLRRRAASWTEVVASADVREQAIRLIRVHDLRSGDALQLAAAMVAAHYQPSSLEFVTFDTHQGEAADKEGFRVIAPG